MTEETARNIHALLLKATGAIDDSVAVLQGSVVNTEELAEYKRAAGRALMAVFDELMAPLYRKHRALIPAELSDSIRFEDGP